MTEPQRPTPAGTDDTGDAAVPEPRPVEEPEVEETTAEDSTGEHSTAEEPTGADEDTSQEASAQFEGSGQPEGSAQPEGSDGSEGVAPPAPLRRRRRDPLAAALIGILTLLLGFAFAVQVRST